MKGSEEAAAVGLTALTVFVAYSTYPSSNQEHQPRCDSCIPCKATYRIRERATSVLEIKTM